MASAAMRGRGILLAGIILAIAGYWWLAPHSPKVLGVAYVADRSVTLWSTLAQVRQPVAVLRRGDRVEVVREEGTAAQVRSPAGQLGWLLDARQLVDSAVWQQGEDLLARALSLPPQAHGRTRTVSNVRLEPGRGGARIFQFPRGTPVVVFERGVADTAPPEDTPADQPSADAPPVKREDWLLVLSDGVAAAGATSSPGFAGAAVASEPADSPGGSKAAPVAGWVLGRFIELDLPEAVSGYLNSSAMRAVAWFELNRVPDGSGGEAPQFLVATTRGDEGQPCDFTGVRVYTWGAARRRYETAYVENGLCGKLPVLVSQSPAGPEFRFAGTDPASGERTYVMRQTRVRRVRQPVSPPSTTRSR